MALVWFKSSFSPWLMYDSIFPSAVPVHWTTSCSFLTPHPATANSMRQIQKQKNGFFRHIEPSLSSISWEMCRLARDITRQIPGGPRVESRPANQYTPYCADGFRLTTAAFHADKRPLPPLPAAKPLCQKGTDHSGQHVAGTGFGRWQDFLSDSETPCRQDGQSM